jgi:hypothetical protein
MSFKIKQLLQFSSLAGIAVLLFISLVTLARLLSLPDPWVLHKKKGRKKKKERKRKRKGKKYASLNCMNYVFKTLCGTVGP